MYTTSTDTLAKRKPARIPAPVSYHNISVPVPVPVPKKKKNVAIHISMYSVPSKEFILVQKKNRHGIVVPISVPVPVNTQYYENSK
jgi:hypothetical protein